MRLYDRVDLNGSIFIWPELKEYFFVSEGSFNLLIVINHVPTCTCTCQQILKKKTLREVKEREWKQKHLQKYILVYQCAIFSSIIRPH